MPIRISPTDGGDLNWSPQLLNRLDVAAHAAVRHFIENFFASEKIPDFCQLSVETYNRCNNDCPFCPCNRNNDTRKPRFMDERLWTSAAI